MINTLTLNPAVDKILYVDEFIKNVTTRIHDVKETIGGKGTHVSINLSIMGKRSRAFGISHGDTGRKVISMLEEHPGIDVKFLYSEKNNTRTNYLLNEKNGDSTLITEKGVKFTEEDMQDIIRCLAENTDGGDFLVFSGDASNSGDPYVYNRIMRALECKGYKVFLDTSGRSLAKCIEERPFLIKPNADELSFVTGRQIKEEAGDVVAGIKELDKYGIPVVAVSMGGEGSVVKYMDGFYRVYPAKVDVKNTVGCGDCYLSGLLYGFSENMDIEDILRFATAVSGAAAESPLSVGFDMERANELVNDIKIEKIQ